MAWDVITECRLHTFTLCSGYAIHFIVTDHILYSDNIDLVTIYCDYFVYSFCNHLGNLPQIEMKINKIVWLLAVITVSQKASLRGSNYWKGFFGGSHRTSCGEACSTPSSKTNGGTEPAENKVIVPRKREHIYIIYQSLHFGALL